MVPTATRGNLYHDAVARITDNSLAELNDVCTKLELQCFCERDFKFLKEYVLVNMHSGAYHGTEVRPQPRGDCSHTYHT